MSTLLTVMAALSLSADTTVGGAQRGAGQRGVVDVKSRPERGVEWERVARLKIASRKSSFRVGEMINIDIAMLNSSKEAVFFRRINHPNLYVERDGKEGGKVVPYGVAEVAATRSAYDSVPPGNLIVESFELLAGCDKRAFDQINSAGTHDDDLTAFDQDLFLNWGSACLEATQAGVYSISVEFSNNWIVAPTGKENTRTAVGKIKSNQLRIEIVD